MKDLIYFLVNKITGSSEIQIEEESQDGRTNYLVKVPKDLLGILIGKGGKTARAIRNLVKIRATIEKKIVNVSLLEKDSIPETQETP